MFGTRLWRAAVVASTMGWAVETATAATQDFYKGKTVRILVGASAGGCLRHLGTNARVSFGEELQKIVERLFKLPPAIANKLKEVLMENSPSVRWAGKRRDFLISISNC
ncbi:MAG: hypothetical protein ACXWX7_09060 [Candidatus Binatia bacterium]